jgi:hypothetical protein
MIMVSCGGPYSLSDSESEAHGLCAQLPVSVSERDIESERRTRTGLRLPVSELRLSLRSTTTTEAEPSLSACSLRKDAGPNAPRARAFPVSRAACSLSAAAT